jgi:predicted GH43/DUF377 family glycosyl hydrolase
MSARQCATSSLNMSGVEAGCVLYRAEQLLPDRWRALAEQGPVRTFNPGLLRNRDGWLFAYRIVAADGRRRIGLCRLNHALEVVEGSQLPWSDDVRFHPGQPYPETARQWFADPRLYRFGEQLFLYWNSGWHEPQNHQFLQEIDGATLLPCDYPRELQLRGERQKLEKNWTFFESDGGEHRAVYSISPHRILGFSPRGTGDIFFEEVSRVEWSLAGYPASHGGLRGGAPPVLWDGAHWSFCHSVHDGPDGYRYRPAVYSFSRASPFAPTAGPTRPLDLGQSSNPIRRYERLNPAVAEVIYPCGAARDGARWLISHGINDECCAISVVEHEDVLASLQRVPTGSSVQE